MSRGTAMNKSHYSRLHASSHKHAHFYHSIDVISKIPQVFCREEKFFNFEQAHSA